MKRESSKRGKRLAVGGSQQQRSSKPARKKVKLGQMRKFLDGFDVVYVWSKDEEEHRAVLAVYAVRGWILESPIPQIVKGSDAPIRSVVKRKLKDIE